MDKILALLWPISCLIACGFEHCVVNMWLIPMGLILKGNSAVLAAAEKFHGGKLDLSNLTFFKGFLIDNLFPVVLGKSIRWYRSGCGCVLVYLFAPIKEIIKRRLRYGRK